MVLLTEILTSFTNNEVFLHINVYTILLLSIGEAILQFKTMLLVIKLIFEKVQKTCFFYIYLHTEL